MDTAELLQRAGLAAAIGLLIGIQRGWQEREAVDGARVAGIRTFTLIALLGAVAAALPGTVTMGFGLAGFALPFGWFEWKKAQRAGTWSATNFVAGLLTFCLGAYAMRGSMALAGAAGVVAAVTLAERQVMHQFLRRLTWVELRAALVLLVMTAVLLPVLPDRAVDPWGALNPHQIWLMTVLVGAVCYGGYIAVRLAGERNGLLFAAVMGGIATSTTVTWTFARLARRNPGSVPEVMAAILAAWIVSLWRMTALAVVITPALLPALAPAILASSVMLLVPAALAWRAAGRTGPHGLVLADPFELPLLLRFTGLLIVILLMAKLFSGPSSLFALGGLSGLLDVDPITLSMARMAGTGLSPTIAVSTILIAAASNGLAKAVLGWSFGGFRLGIALSGFALAAFLAGGAAFAIFG